MFSIEKKNNNSKKHIIHRLQVINFNMFLYDITIFINLISYLDINVIALLIKLDEKSRSLLRISFILV